MTSQLSADHDVAGFVNAVGLKDSLRQIKTNRANPNYSRRGVKEVVSVD